jgi:hypothetical protein
MQLSNDRSIRAVDNLGKGAGTARKRNHLGLLGVRRRSVTPPWHRNPEQWLRSGIQSEQRMSIRRFRGRQVPWTAQISPTDPGGHANGQKPGQKPSS